MVVGRARKILRLDAATQLLLIERTEHLTLGDRVTYEKWLEEQYSSLGAVSVGSICTEACSIPLAICVLRTCEA